MKVVCENSRVFADPRLLLLLRMVIVQFNKWSTSRKLPARTTSQSFTFSNRKSVLWHTDLPDNERELIELHYGNDGSANLHQRS